MSEDVAEEASLRGGEWHWLWDVYVAGLCVTAIVAVFMLSHRYPGSVPPVAVAALAAMAVIAVVFVRRTVRLPELSWRTWAFVGAVVGLWLLALVGSPVAVAAIPAIFPLVFSTLPLRAALIVTTAINLIPLTLLLLRQGTQSPHLPLAIAMTLVGLVTAPVIGIVIMTSMRQRRRLTTLVAELAATRAESARLSRVAERERLSREIHDTLAQGFTSIVALTQAVEAELDTDPAAARKHVELIRSTARENLAEARVMVADLTPAALDDGSLSAAIRRQCDRHSAETCVPVTMCADRNVPPLGMAKDVVLLRAAQEALANVRKHSRATSVRVELLAANDRVRLLLSDNGVGLPDDHVEGFGLHGMRARAAQVGATMTVSQTPGGGTTVTVEVPV
jgi:signal transduction histidine kinase